MHEEVIRTEASPLFSTEMGREDPTPSPETLQRLASFLGESWLKGEVEADRATLAIIRPQVGTEANKLGLSDQETVREIESRIEDLDILAKFSLYLTPDDIEALYDGEPQEIMREKAPIYPDPSEGDLHTRWDEHVEQMTSGPVTVLLLYSFNGDAANTLRSQLGHWNVEQHRKEDKDTIRGELAQSRYNNLVHGADSPEKAGQEIAILRNCIEVSNPA